MKKNKKILIAGGAGFIGSHICDKLTLQGHNVYCIDNLLTGKKKNIEHLINKKNFKFIKRDINQKILLNVDEIYNLACPASPPKYQKNPIETVKASVLGSINLLDLAKKNNAKILQASTSEIYGDPKEHPQKETYNGNVNPVGVRSCYDEGKRCAETLFFDYHREKKVKIRVARIFNTYGPKMDFFDGRVISNFIIQCLENKNLTIYGKGKQTRSFCYIDDMVDALIKFMNLKNNFTGPLNLGNPYEINIFKIAKKIKSLTNSKSKLIFKKLPNDDPVKRKPDISLAKKTLKWLPKISLNEGLLKTIKYFQIKI
jgi:UDP-glucuronate decarboxylase